MVKPSNTIQDVKDMIFDKTGINPIHQYLSKYGKCITDMDSKTLAQLKLRNGSTIQVLLRFKAGIPHHFTTQCTIKDYEHI